MANITFLSFLLFSMCHSIHVAVNTWLNCSFFTLIAIEPRNHRRRSSVNCGGERHFCSKIYVHVWTINRNVRILRNNCPKNSFHDFFFGGGERVPHVPVSYAYARNVTSTPEREVGKCSRRYTYWGAAVDGCVIVSCTTPAIVFWLIHILNT